MITDSSEKPKEDMEMTDEYVYTNNGGAVPPAPITAEASYDDGVLLYQAKLNVKDKQNLKRHVIAFIAALLLIGVLNIVGFRMDYVWDTASIGYRPINTATQHETFQSLYELQFMFPNAAPSIERAINEALVWADWGQNYQPTATVNTQSQWNIVWGAMLFWGGWIACRVLKRVSVLMGLRARRVGRLSATDPVMEEYNRLKRAS